MDARSRLILSQSGRLGPSGSTPSRSKGRGKWRSVSERRGNNCRRGSSSRSRRKERRGGSQKVPSSWSCWSRTGSRSCESSKSSSSRGARSWRNCSSHHLIVCPSRCHQRHKGLKPGRRVCQFMVRRPRRGFVRERRLRSQLSQRGRTEWWRSPV